MVLLACCGCSFALDFEDGVACDEQYPCADGYACAGGACAKVATDGTLQVSGPANLVLGRVSIVSDDNRDDKANKGETIVFNLELTNSGGESAESVQATLSTTDPFATISDSTTSYGTIQGGSSEWGNGYETSSALGFSLLDTTPDGHVVSFALQVSSTTKVYDFSFDVAVVATGAGLQALSTSIVSDNNRDRRVNKGETITFNVQLRNSGTSRVNALQATLTTMDSYATISDSTSSYGDIEPGASEWGNGYETSSAFGFSVLQTAPANHAIDFALDVRDANSNTWTLPVRLTVDATGAALTVQTHAVVGDNNGDGRVNKGESITLNVQLRNAGTSKANAVMATLTTREPDITISDSESSFGDIDAGGSEWGNGYRTSAAFTFTVASSAASRNLSFSLEARDAQANTWPLTFSVPLVATGAQLDVLDSVVIDSDSRLSPGETAALNVQVRNSGTSNARAVTGHLSTTDPLVTITDAESSFGGVDAGASEWGNGYRTSSAFQVRLAASAQAGCSIPFSLALTDAQTNTWTAIFSVTVQ